MTFGRYPFQLGLPRPNDLYIEGKELGRGRFGTTYLYTQVETGRKFACKCIQKKDLNTRRDCKKVVREIDILGFLNVKKHPNIIAIEGAFEDAKNVYVVTELCEGGDLFDRVAKHGPFSENRAAKSIKEVITAIEVCHRHGIIHRDLKLENVLFKTKDEGSSLAVIDFGLAQVFESGDVFVDIVGSPGYIAPEVWEGRHGPKVDVWSAGVILHILLVGFPPFDADSMEGTYNEITTGRGLCFEETQPWQNISEYPKDLLKKMLKFNVEDRLSASEVLEHPWILENA